MGERKMGASLRAEIRGNLVTAADMLREVQHSLSRDEDESYLDLRDLLEQVLRVHDKWVEDRQLARHEFVVALTARQMQAAQLGISQ
jgi:hypothetical protein